MPVTLSTPPEEAAEAALGSLNGSSATRADPSSLVYPHRVYVMDLGHLVSGRSLEAAQAGPWRFLIACNSRLEESVDVIEANTPGGHRVAHRSRGPRNVAAGRALARALATPEFDDAQFEARLLAIPALSVAAWWLVSEKRSVLIPIAAPRGLHIGRQYTPDEFLEALKPDAAERLRFDNSPKPA